ncbi:hypothetical protein RHMOL_Rhmol11G0110900 [Rhododendron molle]|uniref:Uncharacterized protein n=2 Tax=Rhododendron molle TaxID=49168 RepID=A0ACC0LQU9_RHOML|nr:hypothetical protein RHMOL_Rhmol11G0110900 [Rhododendron molle]
MVKIGAWNIRGLNDPLKQKEVRSIIFSNEFSLMGVVETEVRFPNIQATVTNCFPKDWLWTDNFTNGPVARILLGWDKEVFSVHLEFNSEQMLVVKVELCQGNKSFLLSVVYGHNSIIDRRVLWQDLRAVHQSHLNSAWVQMGDFNTVRLSSSWV